MSHVYKHLSADDVSLFKLLLKLFGEIFEEPETYNDAVPNDDYIKDFLRDDRHIVLIAIGEDGAVVGGLVSYELKKFEQVRSEIFVYDLGISEAHRRRGIGTKLFEELKLIAKKRGVYEIFVQADRGDENAISFYRSITKSELEAHHFEIKV